MVCGEIVKERIKGVGREEGREREGGGERERERENNNYCCFQDVFVECEDSYGPIDKMNICDNLGDHLVGNVYIKVS